MSPARCLACLLAATLAAAAWAQTAATEKSGGQGVPAAKRTGKPSGKPVKAVIPDPDLLDGSAHEAEKRPLYGLLSEIEMGGKEGGKAAQVSPESGQSGASAESDPGGGGKNTPSQPQGGQGKDGKIAQGPEAPADGVQAAELKVPEGAQAGGAASAGAKPRDLQIGDATLQIQTLGKNTPNVVGVEASSAQQYEKKVPSGQQTDNRNRGVEKGRVVPKGL